MYLVCRHDWSRWIILEGWKTYLYAVSLALGISDYVTSFYEMVYLIKDIDRGDTKYTNLDVTKPTALFLITNTEDIQLLKVS